MNKRLTKSKNPIADNPSKGGRCPGITKKKEQEEELAFLTSNRGPRTFTKGHTATVAGGSLGSYWPTATVAVWPKRTTALGMQWVVNFNHGVTP